MTHTRPIAAIVQSPQRSAASSKTIQSGIALIAVLWVVAIMSLITVGLVRSVRSEVKVVSMDRQRIEALALGEAAIALAAQQLPVLQREDPNTVVSSIQTQFQGHAVTVEVQNLNGFVNPALAPPELLAKMFENAGLSSGQAQEMAMRIVIWRTEHDESGSNRGIEVPEDLLQVPGMTYDLYARVAGFLTTSVRSAIDVNSSPPEVLAMLGLPVPAAGANAGRTQSPFVRFTATVQLGNATFAVIRDMRIGTSPSRSGLYWHTLNSQLKVVNPIAVNSP